MPSRIIRASALTSPSLAQLSAEAERLFWRLTVTADDHGRFDAQRTVIRAACFPLLIDAISDEDVESWLSELEAVGGVRRYEVEGRPYGFFPGWSTHQRPPRSASKFPEPPPLAAVAGHPPQSAGTRAQVRPGYGVRGKEAGVRKRESSSADDAAFGEFWEAYPRKVEKKEARARFTKVLKGGTEAQTVIEGARRYRDDPNRVDTYTKHPTTWLNHACWEDDPLPDRDDRPYEPPNPADAHELEREIRRML